MDLEGNISVFLGNESEVFAIVIVVELYHLIDKGLLCFTESWWREDLNLDAWRATILLLLLCGSTALYRLGLVWRSCCSSASTGIGAHEFAFGSIFWLDSTERTLDFCLNSIRQQLKELSFLEVGPVLEEIKFTGS